MQIKWTLWGMLHNVEDVLEIRVSSCAHQFKHDCLE